MGTESLQTYIWVREGLKNYISIDFAKQGVGSTSGKSSPSSSIDCYLLLKL